MPKIFHPRRNTTKAIIIIAAVLFIALISASAYLNQTQNLPENYYQTNNSITASTDPFVSVNQDTKKLTEPSNSQLSSGAANPKLTVTLFGSFPCPTCLKLEESLTKLLPKYQNLLRFTWKDYPLELGGANAMLAARAGRCAYVQGKFGPFHRAEIELKQISQAELINIAESQELDVASFTKCLDGNNYDEQIQADIEEAEQLKVTGAPTVFVGKTQIPPPLNTDDITKTITDELEKIKK